jgi:cell migration-inducing and hyaluronan-binding protein
VYFPKFDARFDNDNRGGVAYRTAAIHDLDGSVGGMGDSYSLIHDGENDSVATDEEACEIQPTWNASVCTGDVGRLSLRAGQLASLSPPAEGRQLRGGFGYVRPTFPPPGAARAAPTAPPAPEQTISLVRNGNEFHITGNQSTVRAGTEIRVVTERPTVSLGLSEMNKDSWVIFELPGFANAASGTQQNSMDALRKAGETSYFRDENALWVKLVSEAPIMPIRPSNTQATITVSR